ncbi:DegV family protein [Tissierella sp. MSJ-40]|uniref:DegV family protein n=1 Tax=Tissierella simiarum TaxID=2841534 RepID=A0ABS6EB30_9FIRM|nr:DegV family protein [Tissierella simiarum]MBU5439969.1 DegV family protein [Tissierella simiarum]
MDFRIVADSSCDLNDDLRKKVDIGIVPLKLDVDDKTFVDDSKLNVKDLLTAMKNSLNPIKTSSPSPGDFITEYEKAKNVFVVTLSSALSSTYSNAILAKNIVLEQNSNKFIHVFDSLSASIGETLISLKIFDMIQKSYSKFDIVEKVEQYIKEMKTYFVLESLDNLIKAGRISKVKGLLANALSIKPIMGSDGEGAIKLVEKVRGSKRAYKKLVDVIGEEEQKFEDKILGIAHCNALGKAEELKRDIEDKYNFKEIIIVEMAGLSTVYANDGGIVIAF